MHSKQSGALLVCICSVPAVLLLPKLHPAAVVLSASAAIGLWAVMRDGRLKQSKQLACLAAAVLLILLLGRAAQFTGISYPTARHRLWMNLLMLALAVYASAGGIERILRVSALCFFFLVVIYSLIAVFSVKNINVIYPTGVPHPEIGYTALVWVLLPILLCLHDGIAVRQKRGAWAAALLITFTLPSLLVWLCQSKDFAGYEEFPFYAMVKTIRAFNVVERFEPILSAALTAGNFCLMSAICSLVRQNLKKLFPLWGERFSTCAIAALAAAICTLKAPLPDIMILLIAPSFCGIQGLYALCEKKIKKR